MYSTRRPCKWLHPAIHIYFPSPYLWLCVCVCACVRACVCVHLLSFYLSSSLNNIIVLMYLSLKLVFNVFLGPWLYLQFKHSLRVLSLLSLVSAALNTPTTIYSACWLNEAILTTDVFLALVFTLNMLAKMKYRGIFQVGPWMYYHFNISSCMFPCTSTAPCWQHNCWNAV